MQGTLWLDLLRRVPSDLYSSLAIGLITGEEIVVQQLVRMDEDFVIIRGRMSGSTAEGRVMLVPYERMTLIALNKQMLETEVQAMFAPGAAAPTPAAAPAAPTAPEHRTPLPAAAPAPAIAPAAGQPKPPSKSLLLARLRQRLADKSK